ncbi:MAG: helix-turn-helix domain containing protein [Flavobacteriales bacterium]|nr:helix-turn-helix domain containing protein [Flavobacteriales bacterium]
MIKKATTAEFKRVITDRAGKKPFTPRLDLYRETKHTGTWVRATKIELNYDKQFTSNSRNSRYRTMQRNRAMEAMIKDNLWSPELANTLDIDKNDIRDYYSYRVHLRIAINVQSGEFFDYILKRGKEAYKLEVEKLNEYLRELERSSGNFLRTLLKNKEFKRTTRMPRLLIENRLYSRNSYGRTDLEVLHDKLNELFVLKKNELISKYRFNKERKCLEREIRIKKKEHRELSEQLFYDKESNKNFIFIKAISISKLENGIDKVNQLYITSVRQGEDLLNEYCKWFNCKYETEIKEEQNARIREYNRKYSAKQRAHKKLLKLRRYEQIIELHEEGNSGAQIGRSLGISARTVTDIINKYHAGTLERLGSNIQISTNESIESFSPYELAEEILDREIKKETREYNILCEEMLNKYILKMYQLKFNTKAISKLVQLEESEIKSRLTQLGIEVVEHLTMDGFIPQEIINL